MKPEYHYSVIGPFDRDKLDEIRPMGEGSIRYAAEQAYMNLTGDLDFTHSSGWGISPESWGEARFFLGSDDRLRDAIIQSYFDEKKPFPYRAYKAWYLLRKSEGKAYREVQD